MALPEELYVKHYAYASRSNDTVANTPAAVTPFVTVAGSTTSRAFFTRRRLEKGEDGKEKTCVGCVDYGLKKSHFSTYSTRCSLDVAMLLKVKYQNTKKYIRLLSGFTFLDFIAQAQTPEQDIILEIQIDPGPSPTTQDGISEEDHSTSLTDTNTSLSSSDNDHSSRIEHGTPIGRRTSSQVIPRPTREVSESEAAKEALLGSSSGAQLWCSVSESASFLANGLFIVAMGHQDHKFMHCIQHMFMVPILEAFMNTLISARLEPCDVAMQDFPCVHTAPSLGGVTQRRNVHQEEKVEIMDLNVQDKYLPDHRSDKMSVQCETAECRAGRSWTCRSEYTSDSDVEDNSCCVTCIINAHSMDLLAYILGLIRDTPENLLIPKLCDVSSGSDLGMHRAYHTQRCICGAKVGGKAQQISGGDGILVKIVFLARIQYSGCQGTGLFSNAVDVNPSATAQITPFLSVFHSKPKLRIRTFKLLYSENKIFDPGLLLIWLQSSPYFQCRSIERCQAAICLESLTHLYFIFHVLSSSSDSSRKRRQSRC
ncbi:hypothetical protein D9C73_015708 [Collichthys lucidus]|uniref:Uncharacterized protein n=1 Tax=Collichthys lucidus TaxID=240159 RepID=A0A4U5V1Q0_COLLU|nr:hypothetical protein D9C73_015708 [Collichthys lucidus]